MDNKPQEGFNVWRGSTTMARRTSGAAVALLSRRFLGPSARCCACREAHVAFTSWRRDAERVRRGARGQGRRPRAAARGTPRPRLGRRRREPPPLERPPRPSRRIRLELLSRPWIVLLETIAGVPRPARNDPLAEVVAATRSPPALPDA